jgi:hypothetical protein
VSPCFILLLCAYVCVCFVCVVCCVCIHACVYMSQFMLWVPMGVWGVIPL